MRRKQIRTIIIVAVIVVLLAGVTVLAVNNYGSSSDPLVTMSYINDNLAPSLQYKFSSQLNAKSDALSKSFVSAVSENAGGFKTVAMTKGQKLTCSAGCEILLVSGSASAVNANVLTDVTTGSAVAADGALTANHLYMTVTEGIAVTATSAAGIMVRGTATVS